jgi:hypothetical protein
MPFRRTKHPHPGLPPQREGREKSAMVHRKWKKMTESTNDISNAVHLKGLERTIDFSGKC